MKKVAALNQDDQVVKLARRTARQNVSNFEAKGLFVIWMLKSVGRVTIDAGVEWNDATAVRGRFDWTINIANWFTETDVPVSVFALSRTLECLFLLMSIWTSEHDCVFTDGPVGIERISGDTVIGERECMKLKGPLSPVDATTCC